MEYANVKSVCNAKFQNMLGYKFTVFRYINPYLIPTLYLAIKSDRIITLWNRDQWYYDKDKLLWVTVTHIRVTVCFIMPCLAARLLWHSSSRANQPASLGTFSLSPWRKIFGYLNRLRIQKMDVDERSVHPAGSTRRIRVDRGTPVFTGVNGARILLVSGLAPRWGDALSGPPLECKRWYLPLYKVADTTFCTPVAAPCIVSCADFHVVISLSTCNQIGRSGCALLASIVSLSIDRLYFVFIPLCMSGMTFSSILLLISCRVLVLSSAMLSWPRTTIILDKLMLFPLIAYLPVWLCIY